KKAADWIWVQEEPENMGAWQFIAPRLTPLVKKRPVYLGRDAAASPATGFSKIHKTEQDGIVDRAVGSHNHNGSMAG
ncbi:MAG TPA: hypothetical protein VLT88_12685, partial [Desulfosarcina sp.]|nr:hypothetical protein [Desulfosarcina sp.]